MKFHGPRPVAALLALTLLVPVSGTAANGLAYVSNQNVDITVIDLDIDRVDSRRTVEHKSPRGIGVAPDDRLLIMANRDGGDMSVIEPSSGRVIRHVKIGKNRESVRISGNQAPISFEPSAQGGPGPKDAATTEGKAQGKDDHDDREPARTAVVDRTRLALAREITGGPETEGVEFSPDGKTIPVTNEADNSVSAHSIASGKPKAAGLQVAGVGGCLPGKEVVDVSGIIFVRICGGSFAMGSSDKERETFPADFPLHPVMVPEFWLAKTEVTNAQFRRWRKDHAGDDELPVGNVTWNDGQAYCAAQGHRLPSEAEWEYAARAGTSSRYSFGNDEKELDRYAWYRDNSSGRAHRVASKQPNAWGLHDMHGNVGEWVQDCGHYHQNYKGAPVDGSAWEGAECPTRVMRGGTFASPTFWVRSAERGEVGPTDKGDLLGFRCARRRMNTNAGSSVTKGSTQYPKREGDSTAVVDSARGESGVRGVASAPAVPVPPASEVTQVFRDCPDCPEMVVIPAGEFTMGSPEGDEGRSAQESPQHRVRIATPFAAGRYEVTFAEWDACVSGGGCRHKPGDQGWGRGTQPVINVSWNDAQEYVDWMSKKTGKRYRLLSEAEWEYAARAATVGSRYWGEDADQACRFANVGDQRLKAKRPDWPSAIYWCDDGAAETAAVGRYQPNAFGLYDMLGNVWEWVQDCSQDNYAGAPSDGSAWETGKCEARVVRGGSWNSGPQYVRSAFRTRNVPSFRNLDSGFRLARTLP